MNRDFKGIWIPREIWLNKNLSIQAKSLWAEISSLHDRDSGGCFATNEYLCEFLGVKLSRLKEVMKELRDLGFLEDVSFNGRNRIIKAVYPEVEYGGQQTAGKPASCQPENRPSDSRNPGCPSYSIGTIGDPILDTPPIPPQSEPPKEAAKAAEKRDDLSSQSKEVSAALVEVIKEEKPNYKFPKNFTQWNIAIAEMIRDDNRTKEQIVAVFRWAVSDSFWRSHMFKQNPPKYLREKFDQLEEKSKSKPPVNPNQVDRRLKDKEGNAVDSYKDLMF